MGLVGMNDEPDWTEFHQKQKGVFAQIYLEFALARAENTPTAHAQLEADLPNLLNAAAWLWSHADRPGLLKMAAALWEQSNFFRTRGQAQRAISLLEQARDAAHQMADFLAECDWLEALGFVYWHFAGDYHQAQALYQQTLALAQQINYPQRLALAQLGLGRLYIDLAQFDAAMPLLTEAQQGYHQIHDQVGEIAALLALGALCNQQGDSMGAINYLTRALPLAQAIRDAQNEARLFYTLGHVALKTQNWPEAAKHFEMALAVARQADDRPLEARSLTALGEVNLAQGHAPTAIELLEQALNLQEAAGDMAAVPFTRFSLGKIYAILNQTDKSLAQLNQAYPRLLEMRSAGPAAMAAAYTAWLIADNHLKRGDSAQARAMLQAIQAFDAPPLAELRQAAAARLQSLA